MDFYRELLSYTVLFIFNVSMTAVGMIFGVLVVFFYRIFRVKPNLSSYIFSGLCVFCIYVAGDYSLYKNSKFVYEDDTYVLSEVLTISEYYQRKFQGERSIFIGYTQINNAQGYYAVNEEVEKIKYGIGLIIMISIVIAFMIHMTRHAYCKKCYTYFKTKSELETFYHNSQSLVNVLKDVRSEDFGSDSYFKLIYVNGPSVDQDHTFKIAIKLKTCGCGDAFLKESVYKKKDGEWLPINNLTGIQIIEGKSVFIQSIIDKITSKKSA